MPHLERLTSPQRVATDRETAQYHWVEQADRERAEQGNEVRPYLQHEDQQEYADERPALPAHERPRVGDPAPTVAGRHAAPFGNERTVRPRRRRVFDVGARRGVRVFGHSASPREK